MSKSSGFKIISDNRKARFDFTIEEVFEAGLVLRGSEVKSLRAGQCNLKDSYIAFVNGEAFLQNAHISPYKASSSNNHEPERLRKLLLHKIELDKLERAITEKGYTCVPLKLYFKGSHIKAEIALVKGKKAHDKREVNKKRDVQREIRSATMKSRK